MYDILVEVSYLIPMYTSIATLSLTLSRRLPNFLSDSDEEGTQESPGYFVNFVWQSSLPSNGPPRRLELGQARRTIEHPFAAVAPAIFVNAIQTGLIANLVELRLRRFGSARCSKRLPCRSKLESNGPVERAGRQCTEAVNGLRQLRFNTFINK